MYKCKKNFLKVFPNNQWVERGLFKQSFLAIDTTATIRSACLQKYWLMISVCSLKLKLIKTPSKQWNGVVFLKTTEETGNCLLRPHFRALWDTTWYRRIHVVVLTARRFGVKPVNLHPELLSSLSLQHCVAPERLLPPLPASVGLRPPASASGWSKLYFGCGASWRVRSPPSTRFRRPFDLVRFVPARFAFLPVRPALWNQRFQFLTENFRFLTFAPNVSQTSYFAIKAHCYQAHNLENFSPPLEECVGHSLKLLDTVQKFWAPLRKLSVPPGAPSWLRAWLLSSQEKAFTKPATHHQQICPSIDHRVLFLQIVVSAIGLVDLDLQILLQIEVNNQIKINRVCME